MLDRERYRPFTGDTSRRIRLKSAPLELVLCQVRWPELAHLQGDLKPIALKFGQSMTDYPVYDEVQEVSYTITPEGVQQSAGGTIYQWRSLEADWHVSLSRRFLSLYCTRYEDFGVFSERLRPVVEAAGTVVGIPLVERVGVRYVNRLTEQQLIANLREYVRPEILGYAALPSPASGAVALVSNANQARYTLGDMSLQVRSGIVPPGETVDPAIQPTTVDSWVLDLDAFSESVRPFGVSPVMEVAGRLSDTAYDFFKLVTTDGFLREFGGDE